MKHFGKFIRNKRKSLRLTQDEMAHRCGVGVTTIVRWEGKERPDMLLSAMEALANALEMDPVDLYAVYQEREIAIGTPEDLLKNRLYEAVIDLVMNRFSKDEILGVMAAHDAAKQWIKED